MDATDSNGKKETFYGYIEEIWELVTVPISRCLYFGASG